MIQRGDIWWADLGERRGPAPAFHRPVVVMQSDDYNKSRLSTAVVVVLSSNPDRASIPGNVRVPRELSGLRDDSVAIVTQVSTVDRREFHDRVGLLPDWLVDEIASGLRRVLAL